MATIISISTTEQNKLYCKEKNISKSKLFADALFLHQKMFEFSHLDRIPQYYSTQEDLIRKIGVLQKEIVRRNETIEALQDVLANKEIEQRRV